MDSKLSPEKKNFNSLRGESPRPTGHEQSFTQTNPRIAKIFGPLFVEYRKNEEELKINLIGIEKPPSPKMEIAAKLSLQTTNNPLIMVHFNSVPLVETEEKRTKQTVNSTFKPPLQPKKLQH